MNIESIALIIALSIELGICIAEITQYIKQKNKKKKTKYIVTCNDCKHRIYKQVEPYGDVGGCEVFNCALMGDFYCAYGERKGGDE